MWEIANSWLRVSKTGPDAAWRAETAFHGLQTFRYPPVKSGMCFSTHLMNETASPLSD
jgi:hypothetical protein